MCIPEPRILQSAVADAKPLADALEALRRRLEDEEASYAEALAELDRQGGRPAAGGDRPRGPRAARGAQRAVDAAPPARAAAASARALERRAFDALAPVIERQARFNAVLVRLLNAQLEHAARYHARLRELAAALVRYAQRVEPVVDARDDMRVARAPTRDRRRCSRSSAGVSRRWASGSRACSRCATALEVALGGGAGAARGARGAAPRRRRRPAPRRARRRTRPTPRSRTASAARARRSARRQADYVELLRGHAPVVDLGCGRGEFLELLRAAGHRGARRRGQRPRGAGVPGQGARRRRGRPRGVPRRQDAGASGAVFAAQVAEHLPPRRLAGAARGRPTARSPRTGCSCSRR